MAPKWLQVRCGFIVDVHEHLINYFDFDVYKEKNNSIVAFTIYPFCHDSKMLQDVQYTDARLFTFLVTVNCPR